MLNMRDISEEESCPRCNKCERWRAAPDYMQDPWLIWERFPCPPPGTNKARLLLELDWTGNMGPKDGCRALERVAARCKIDLTSVKIIPSSLTSCDKLFEPVIICGTQCVVAIILACICFLFVILLAIVCYRYVRRNEHKQSSPTCTKVLASDQTALNTHINRYYVQSQYYYRAGNIPERRCLPVEVRTTENGVEARLIRAIQAPPRPNYPFEEICSQCMNGSKQSILTDRARQGYERIYWKDKEYLQQRVPSNDSLHRKQADRHRSTAGSSSDMSHYYEYIGDPLYDSSTGRRSNHSIIYAPRNSSLNFKEVQNCSDTRHSDDERGFIYPRIPSNDFDLRDSGRQERVPSRCSADMRSGTLNDRNPYQGSLSDHYNYLDNTLDYRFKTPSISSHENARHRHLAQSSPAEGENGGEIIKGYKYTYNPYFDEETTASVKDSYDISTSPETPSECIEFDDLGPSNRYSRENCLVPSPNYTRTRAKSRTPSLRSNKNSESTSLSDYSTKSNTIHVPLTNGTFYKTNGTK